MSSNTSGGVGHGGLPSDAPPGQESAPSEPEAPAAKRPPASMVSRSGSDEVSGFPQSTPSAKRPQLAVTLMGIPAAIHLPERDKPTAAGRAANSRVGGRERLSAAISGTIGADGAITGTDRGRNLGGRLKPKVGNRDAIAEGARRSVVPVSGGRVPTPSDDEGDSDEGDVVAGSSVLGRCLVGAAVGVTLALLLVGVVRLGGRMDGAHDPEQGFPKAAAPMAPRWKPATPFAPPPPVTTTPAIEDQSAPDDSTPSSKGWSRKAAGSEGPSATGGAAAGEGGGTLEEQPLDGSGAPTLVGAPAAEPLRAPVRSKRPPPRSSTAPASGSAEGTAIESPPAENSELPSARAQQPSPSSEKLRLKSKSGSGSDPDSTMAPSLD